MWITQGSDGGDRAALEALDIPSEPELSRRVLERRGVPSAAIHVLPGYNDNTADEVRLVSRRLREAGGDTVIVVTSKPHTRRVRVLWRLLAGDPDAVIVRYPPDDPFDPDAWWRNTRDALAVVREYFGILNAWAGFPVGSARYPQN